MKCVIFGKTIKTDRPRLRNWRPEGLGVQHLHLMNYEGGENASLFLINYFPEEDRYPENYFDYINYYRSIF